MKYLVMECHAGYAVLMDEASRFVKAANLHYEVGQTVTAPVLMEETKPAIRRSTVVRIAAAAACLVLLSGIGLKVYQNRRKARSSIRLCSELEFEMQLNSAGEIIRISSSTESGQAMLDSVSVRKKDMAEVVGELLTLQREQGYIAEGETVSIYIDSEDEQKYEEYKSGVETEAEKLNLLVSVQPPQPPHEHEKGDPPAEPPGIGSGLTPGGAEEPPQEALHTVHDAPEPPQPPEGTKHEKHITPAGPGSTVKPETGTAVRHPDPPAEHGTAPSAQSEHTEPQVTTETQPADTPVPPETPDLRGLPHTDPPHRAEDDTPAEPEAGEPETVMPPHEQHDTPGQPEQPALAGDTESDTQDELPVSDTTDETETVISPEPQDTPAEHPEPHPPIPQAAERPHI
ncbi:MAG: hypothetical protein J6Z45_02175 [Oscillospiraceae bacterium]|nr:hypothetical protein [Oscillospiraceae bacterium]